MFKFLNNYFSRAKKRMQNNSGQIAIIIILLIAISIIFFAVSMNFGQLSNTKAAVTMASNIGASMLGSEMASYGQYLFETQLDGHENLCAGTNILVLVLTLIILTVIAIIAAPFTYGASLSLFGVEGAILAMALLVAAVILIQLVYIQPGITAMWNALQQEQLNQIDRFVEQGISAGLGHIVSDQKSVPDFYDYDQDMLWGIDSTGEVRDWIARYVVYYTNRLNNVPKTESDAVKEFLKALEDFVYEDPFDYANDGDPSTVPDGWALFDPVGSNFNCDYDYAASSDSETPSVCNKCCVALDVEDPMDPSGTIPIRSELCDCAPGTCSAIEEEGKTFGGYCSRNSMYPDNDSIGGGEGYRYTYDMFFENPDNEFASFIEQIGVDDEVKNFYKNKADINHQQFRNPPVLPPRSGSYSHTDQFRIQDASGYYFIHPEFSPTGTPPHRLIYQVDYQAFTECITHCSNKNCALEADALGVINGPLPVEPVYDPVTEIGYDYSGLLPFDERLDCSTTDDPPRLTNGGGRGWLDAIRANRDHVVAPDGRRGIFPLLYKLRDWGLDLTKTEFTIPQGAFSTDFKSEYCHWYDTQYGGGPCPYDTNYPLPEQLRYKPLDLPLDPSGDSIDYNITPFVDGKNLDLGPGVRGYLAVDRVHIGFDRSPPGEYNQLPIIAEENECAQDAFDQALTPIGDQFGFWKSGDDRFCAPEDNSAANADDPDGIYWPYETQCDRSPKDGTPDETCIIADENQTAEDTPIDLADPEITDYIQGVCECSNADAASDKSLFRDDVLDDLVYGMRYFIDFADSLLIRKVENNVRDFKIWYAQAAPWIEPGTSTEWDGHGAVKYEITASNPDPFTPPYDPPPCYVCDERDGALWYWQRQIEEFATRFQGLLDGPYMSVEPYDTGDTVCDQVWCGPPVDSTIPGYDPDCFEEASNDCIDDSEWGSTISYEYAVTHHYNWPVTYDVAEDCAYIWPDEKDEMDNDLNGVISCLDYNVARESPSEYFGAYLRLGDVVGYGIYDGMYMDLLNDMLARGYIDSITTGSSGRISETFTDDVPNVGDFVLSASLDPLVLVNRGNIYNIILNNIENSLETTPERFQNCIDNCVILSEWVEHNNALGIDEFNDRVQPDNPTHDRDNPITVWGSGGGEVIADQAASTKDMIEAQTASACDCPITLHPIVATKAAQACTDRSEYFLPRSLVYLARHDSSVTRFNPSGEMDTVKQGVFNSYFDCKYRCFEGKMNLYEAWSNAYDNCLSTYNLCMIQADVDADNFCHNTADYLDCETDCASDLAAHNTCRALCDSDYAACVSTCSTDPDPVACELDNCILPADCYADPCDIDDTANGYVPNCLTVVCGPIYDACYNGTLPADPGDGEYEWRALACLYNKEGDPTTIPPYVLNYDHSGDACEPAADTAYTEARDLLTCGGRVDKDIALSVVHDYVTEEPTIVDFTAGNDISYLYCFNPDDGHFQLSEILYDNILLPSLGSCDETPIWEGVGMSRHVSMDPDTGEYILSGWLRALQLSIPEAMNQGAKFKKRVEFLRMLRSDIVKARDIFRTAYDKFEELLTCEDEIDNSTGLPGQDGIADGAVCELIIERSKNKDTGLPYQVVYGWEGEPSINRPAPNEGKPYWHIVKVEARGPQKCDARCNVNQDGPQRWPYVKTYTKNWGLTRCFKVAEKNGTVKFRVTRWDEDRDKGRVLTFPNGMPIWDFRFSNPEGAWQEAGVSGVPIDPAALGVPGGPCWNSTLQDTGFPAPHDDDYQGAFMMNELHVDPGHPEEDNTTCWETAHYLLSDGIASETCAQYYWADSRHGYSFKFVDCKNF